MHQIQKDLLSLSRNINLGERSLRDIGRLIGVNHPEKIKHHLGQLEKKGFIVIDKRNSTIRNVNRGQVSENKFINIPIVGSANCGPAQLLAEENLDGYMKLSASLLSSGEHFALKAVGDSMNQANVQGNPIEEGDYVIVDKSKQTAENGKYVLAVIDDAAMIKKFYAEKDTGTVMFLSESSYDFPPIVASESDLSDIYINGEVVKVIKEPKL